MRRRGASFSQAVCSIRAAAVSALLVSTTFEFTSSKKADSGSTTSERKACKKGHSKKTTKQTTEADMKDRTARSMRIKVGGVKLVLALAGVRRQPFIEG